jgi:hypothetical protein
LGPQKSNIDRGKAKHEAKGRKILEVGQTFQIREEIEPYNALFCLILPETSYQLELLTFS